MKNPSWTLWIAWFGATLMACAMLCGFVFLTFQTKSDAAQLREVDQKAQSESKSDMVQRLDRIENKVDKLLNE